MMTRSIVIVAYATLLALLLPGQGNCFAPPGITISSISGTSTEATTFQANKAITRTNLPMSSNSNNSEIEGPDRVLSCLPYLIPLLDGERYGRFLFYAVPALGQVDFLLLGPFKLIYSSIPFAQFIAFIALSTLSRNPDLPRPLRFNMQQALLLDIALIFPSLLGRLQIPLPGVLAASGSNFVYLAMVASVGYSLVSNLTGKVPDKIPIVSEAAGSSIGFWFERFLKSLVLLVLGRAQYLQIPHRIFLFISEENQQYDYSNSDDGWSFIYETSGGGDKKRKPMLLMSLKIQLIILQFLPNTSFLLCKTGDASRSILIRHS